MRIATRSASFQSPERCEHSFVSQQSPLLRPMLLCQAKLGGAAAAEKFPCDEASAIMQALRTLLALLPPFDGTVLSCR